MALLRTSRVIKKFPKYENPELRRYKSYYSEFITSKLSWFALLSSSLSLLSRGVLITLPSAAESSFVGRCCSKSLFGSFFGQLLTFEQELEFWGPK